MKIFILLLGIIALASNSVLCCFSSGGSSGGGGGGVGGGLAYHTDSQCSSYDHETFGCVGKCISTSDCPGSEYQSNLCPTQPANVKCCFTADTDANCAFYHGSCIESSQCPGKAYWFDLCPTKANGVECCFSKPEGTCGGGAGDGGGVGVSAQALACQILAHSNIYLMTTHPSGVEDEADPYSNIEDTCDGGQAIRSTYRCSYGADAPGGYVSLKASVLSYILDVANSGKYGRYLQINSIAGACHASPNSLHYDGTAVDFQVNSGDRNPAYWRNWMSICSSQGARHSLGPGDNGHKNHVHCGFAP